MGIEPVRITINPTWRGGGYWTCKHSNEASIECPTMECGCTLAITNGPVAPARTGEAGLREALLQPKFQWQVAEKWWNDSAGPGRPFHLQGEESQQLYLGRVREVIGIALQIAALAATPVASKVKETPHE